MVCITAKISIAPLLAQRTVESWYWFVVTGEFGVVFAGRWSFHNATIFMWLNDPQSYRTFKRFSQPVGQKTNFWRVTALMKLSTFCKINLLIENLRSSWAINVKIRPLSSSYVRKICDIENSTKSTRLCTLMYLCFLTINSLILLIDRVARSVISYNVVLVVFRSFRCMWNTCRIGVVHSVGHGPGVCLLVRAFGWKTWEAVA